MLKSAGSRNRMHINNIFTSAEFVSDECAEEAIVKNGNSNIRNYFVLRK